MTSSDGGCASRGRQCRMAVTLTTIALAAFLWLLTGFLSGVLVAWYLLR